MKNIFKNGKMGDSRKGSNRDLEDYLVDAIELFENGEYNDAGERFGTIAKLYPDHPLAHLMLARCCIELNEFERAITSLHNHLRIVPNSLEARIYLGLAYYECKAPDLAMEKFEEALAIKGNSMLAWENLIITKISSGKLDEALNDLTSLKEKNPNDRNIVELIVLTLGRLGKWEAAKQYVHSMDKPVTIGDAA
jgi:tetratricopeptide (TPR) repeat protein